MKSNKIALLLAAIFFLSIFYIKVPFQYGLWNNEEELPLIFKLIDKGSYLHDDYVTVHTNNYSQVTPYIYTISSIAKIFHLNDLTGLFFILHLLTMTFLYLSIRKLYKATSKAGEVSILISILSLFLFIKIVNPIPNGRWLFINFLDPEFVTFPFLFYTIAFYIEKNYIKSYIFIAIATILHPLYTIPLLFPIGIGLIYRLCKKNITVFEFIYKGSLYTIAIMAYTFFLWLKSKQTIISNFDPSLVLEIIRSPWHNKIHSIFSLDKHTLLFFLYSIILTLITIYIVKHKFNDKQNFLYDKFNFIKKLIIQQKTQDDEQINKNLKNNFIELMIFNLSLLSLLLLISLSATFVRIPLLIQLSPFRITVIVIVLTWSTLTISIITKIKINDYILTKTSKLIISICIIALAILSSFLAHKNYLTPEKLIRNQSYERELISWINKNTSQSDLFLNYSYIDVRVMTYRSDYFKFKTFPLIADYQVKWYEKYLIFNDIPSDISSTDYPKIKKYTDKKHSIDLIQVLKKSNKPIKYILIPQLPYWMEAYTFNPRNLKEVFHNNRFIVYTTENKKLN